MTNSIYARMLRGALAVLIAASFTTCHATTKGLNQIVTPDIQPKGQLSISYQQQDPSIGERMEVQEELGITKSFEIAVFEGTSPALQVLNAELGLYNHGPWLLSTGFTGWATNGVSPAPFLEGGYYNKNLQLDLGVLRGPSQDLNNGNPRSEYGYQGIAGIAYSPSSHLKLAVDYQSQQSNFATAGFTYAITPSLNINPAIYLSNSTPHKGFGYAVLTWTVQAF